MNKWVKGALALQFAVAGVALAQARSDDNTQLSSKDQSSATTRPVKTGTNAGYEGILGGEDRAPAGTIRASKLIGAEVYNDQGKHLGEIKDIVLDQDHKKIGYAVLSYGGIAGLGDKLFAVPRNVVKYSQADNRATVALSEDTLKNAPGFDKSKWPTQANADYYQNLDRYYKDQGAQPAAGQLNRDQHQTSDQLSWNRKLSSLVGANVENANGDNLGEVKDVVLDWNRGDVRYAVLSYGGFLGMGDKLFAVPIDAFQTKPDSSKLVLNISKDQLKNAPGFNQDQWPDMADPQWTRSVGDFYKQNRSDQNRSDLDKTDRQQ